jgi:hypothetical protein
MRYRTALACDLISTSRSGAGRCRFYGRAASEDVVARIEQCFRCNLQAALDGPLEHSIPLQIQNRHRQLCAQKLDSLA